jgi:protein-S-isoprenylcysteine O-methyltransferase Ste14
VTVAQRTLLFTIAFPGSIVGLVPLWILHARLPPGHDWTTTRAFLGYAVAALGASVYVVCAREFATRGRGTPAPYDPPRELVASGLYRWVRNPMYVGIFTILAGEALVFGSRSLALYTVLLALGFHVRVALFEERALGRVFGDSYARYRATVPRWIPRPPRRSPAPAGAAGASEFSDTPRARRGTPRPT